jgi:hypothetical protein
MKFWKTTTIALLAGITAFPVIGMEMPTKSVKTSSQKRTSEKSGALAAIDRLILAHNEAQVHDAADEAMSLLHQNEDQIQALLNHYRAGEQNAYNDRAYNRGADYTRLYKYQEGHHHFSAVTPHTALGKLQNSSLNKKIEPSESLLKDIHSLMSLLEQCRETALVFVADKNNATKHKRFTDLAGQFIVKYEMLQKNPLWAEIFDSPEGFNLEEKIGSDLFNPEAICPDHLIIGKDVHSLFPHFSIEGWKHSSLSRDVRTGRPKEPITQIRLQGKLWDVFADKEGASTAVPQAQWDHMQNKYIPHPDYNMMKFLDEKNKSKICVYKFNADEGHGQMPGHWHHGPLQKTYSIVLIPAKEQHPEPRDKTYDEVPNRLAEEIKGEKLKGAEDVTNSKDRNEAVHEEMRQRLARRDFEDNRTRRLHRRDIPMEKGSEGYLMPSDIKDQTYGRVHVPDHRYGRAYERAHNFVPSVTAHHNQVNASQTIRENWESSGGHSLEDKGLEKKHDGIAGGRGEASKYYHEKGLSHDGSQNKNFNHVPGNDHHLAGKEKVKDGEINEKK